MHFSHVKKVNKFNKQVCRFLDAGTASFPKNFISRMLRGSATLLMQQPKIIENSSEKIAAKCIKDVLENALIERVVLSTESNASFASAYCACSCVQGAEVTENS